MRRHVQRWLPWLLGMVLGAALVMIPPLLRGAIRRHYDEAGLAPLPQPISHVAGDADGGAALPVSGKVTASIEDFAMDDPEGHRVVSIRHLEAKVNAGAMREQRLHMPEGEATGIVLTLRRGPSGRVSLTEPFDNQDGDDPQGSEAADPAQAPSSGMQLDIGPLEAQDIRLTIAMSDSPVIVHVTRARVRVQRSHGQSAPRLFLSRIQGRLVKPDPLPNPIEIHTGEGVVDLGEDPLVDLRVRVCLARGELRLAIRVPARHANTRIIVDGDRFMGHTAMAAMGMVGWFKDKLDVERGEVEVPSGRACEGRTGSD